MMKNCICHIYTRAHQMTATCEFVKVRVPIFRVLKFSLFCWVCILCSVKMQQPFIWSFLVDTDGQVILIAQLILQSYFAINHFFKGCLLKGNCFFFLRKSNVGSSDIFTWITVPLIAVRCQVSDRGLVHFHPPSTSTSSFLYVAVLSQTFSV